MWKVVLLLSVAAVAGAALIRPRPLAAAVRAAAAVRGPSISTDTFDQRLDHFSPVDRRTWKQQYVSWVGENAGDGPAFILLTGQEPIQSQMELMGSFAKDLGDALGGRSFHLEHRFYGASRPTGDMTLDSLRYLTQDQALADIADFIIYLRKQALIPAKAKVVLYGGGYAGNLATWARIKYPHLVHAAVASSAPLRAQVDYPEFIDEVMKMIETHGGEECKNNIMDVVNYVDTQSKTASGTQSLIIPFRLCTPFGSKPWDVEMLFNRIASVPVGTVQAMDIEPSVDIVAETCYGLAQATTPLMKVQALAELGGFGMSDATCEAISYEDSIAAARRERYGEALDQNERQVFDRAVLYQACTERGGFPTLAHWKGHYPLELSLQKCKDAFGSGFDKQLLEKAVNRTNEEFGGSAPDVRRVVFVRGADDPNNAFGVRDDLEDMEPVITIVGQSANAEMERESDRDSAEVKKARAAIKQQLNKFLAMAD